MITAILVLIVLLAVVVTLHQQMLFSLQRRLTAVEGERAVPRGCQHDAVKNVGTFGLPVWECEDCHRTVHRGEDDDA